MWVYYFCKKKKKIIKVIKFKNKDLEYIVFLSVKKIPSGRLTACWLLLVLCHLKNK